MKKITLLITLLFSVVVVFGQCPATNITLSSQEEIDNFAINYPNCTILNNDLQIEEQDSDITNLNGLSLLTTAQYIFILNTHIENFTGLENLESISHLAIWGNGKLENFEGLNSLQYMGRLDSFLNNNLINLSGMDAIQTINNIHLFGNSNLNDITDLSFVEVLNDLTLGGNDLISLAGLENLFKITGNLNINDESIPNLDELASLQQIGGSLFLNSNEELQDMSGLSNIQTLENLYIIECPNLVNLVGLSNLHTVDGKLRVGFNHGLETMFGLLNIYSINDLEIYENDILYTLKGLESLTKVTKRILINDNPKLKSLEHISDVSPNELDDLIMINNYSLTICNYPLICAIIDDESFYKVIQNNAPGCNSVDEVELSCMLGLNDENEFITEGNILENQLVFYPNPVSEILTISVSEDLSYKNAEVFTVFGDKILETSEKSINFSSLSAGIYFVALETDKGSVLKKIIKK